MLETVLLDTRTCIIKSDNEGDLQEIMDYISKVKKANAVQSFLQFASDHRIEKKDYLFNREDCYGRNHDDKKYFQITVRPLS